MKTERRYVSQGQNSYVDYQLENMICLGQNHRTKKDVAMTDALETLIAKAQKIQMTDDQEREQRRSFVYGNTNIENDRITREMVAAADEKVSQEYPLR